MTDIIHTETPIPTEPYFAEPYNTLLPKLQTLSKEEIVAVNLDIPSAVATALGVAPQVRTLKDLIATDCPRFDAAPILELETYARALSHAHTLYMVASQPEDLLKPLVDEGTALHETLLADATSLVQRRLLNGEQLKDLKGIVGYKNLAFDLQILAALFRENMSKLEGRCPTQLAELDRADEIASNVLTTVGLREKGPPALAETTDTRARAFTLFTKVYDQARRVVTFLRWNEDDIDEIVPSLYAGRGGHKKAPDPGVPPPMPVPPTPTPANTPPGPTPPVTHPATAPGGPNANPFLS